MGICPGCGRCRECGQPAPLEISPWPAPWPYDPRPNIGAPYHPPPPLYPNYTITWGGNTNASV